MNATADYTVILEHGKGGWSAYVPDLPGCVAAARSRARTETLIREAIALHVRAMRADGDPIPPPSSQALLVSIPA